MDACHLYPGTCSELLVLVRLWSNGAPSFKNRDSTLHLATMWLRCIVCRVIEPPQMGKPHDARVSRQLRHLFAYMDFAVCFTLMCVSHTLMSNWRLLGFRVLAGHLLTANSGTSTAATAESRGERSPLLWQRAILWLSRGV